MIDISNIERIKSINNLKDINSLNTNEIGDSLDSFTIRHMNQSDKIKVYNLLKKLQEYTELSWEYISYLILTSKRDHNKVINLMGSNYLKKEIKPQINKIKKILKENNELKIKNKNYYYKSLNVTKGSINYVNKKRIYHFFKI